MSTWSTEAGAARATRDEREGRRLEVWPQCRDLVTGTEDRISGRRIHSHHDQIRTGKVMIKHRRPGRADAVLWLAGLVGSHHRIGWNRSLAARRRPGKADALVTMTPRCLLSTQSRAGIVKTRGFFVLNIDFFVARLLSWSIHHGKTQITTTQKIRQDFYINDKSLNGAQPPLKWKTPSIFWLLKFKNEN